MAKQNGNTKGNYNPTFDRDGIPLMLNWSCQDIGDWVKNDCEFPQYENCFVSNCINGRKLIWMDASNLQKIGIRDFEHLKVFYHTISMYKIM